MRSRTQKPDAQSSTRPSAQQSRASAQRAPSGLHWQRRLPLLLVRQVPEQHSFLRLHVALNGLHASAVMGAANATPAPGSRNASAAAPMARRERIAALASRARA